MPDNYQSIEEINNQQQQMQQELYQEARNQQVEHDSVKHANKKDLDKAQGGGGDQVDAIYLAYYFILQAVNVQQQTAETQAKQLQVNAAAQANLNSEQEKINYITIPASLKGKHLEEDIPKIQAKNEQVEKLREGLTNNLIILRQNAQVNETQLNTSLNDTEQSAQEGAGLLNMLVNVTNQILK